MKAFLLTTMVLAALTCNTIGYSKEAKENKVETKSDSATSTTVSEKQSLVVYFSMPETTDPNNMTTDEDNSSVVIDGEVLGNTQYMAYVIQKSTGADIFRIKPLNPYPINHETLVDLAAAEKDSNARPAIAERIENFAQYDTVFIGYPIWWADMPMILYAFFEEYDFSGKTVVPFSTHGGSRFAGTPQTIQRLDPEAKMLNGLTISRDRIQNAEQQILDWVNGLDL
ncbi:flavodoxin [uncultured Desulfuromusa sp.]|uniref:flavodoxin n=1 Tax=uncultured Desulfuromusa sp. TaxID=219183 RepID=UPI002AA643B6|nr:flavodoxin [uncultured Desulfuromusa sp.]